MEEILKELFLMQQTYATMFSLANKLQVKSDQSLDGLTSRQFMTMIAIAHLPEEKSTINNIARKLGTTKQNAKQLVDILVRKECITLVASKKDKRAINVRITKTGQIVFDQAMEQGTYFFAELFSDFTTEELEILWSLLKKLYGFDGEVQDGFEEGDSLEMDDARMEHQLNIINEFAKRRMKSKENK